MTVADYAFYAFAIVLITSGLMVTVARNPVHSVLWLILAFLNAAGLFVLLGAEFVVMMLDIDFAELKGEMARYMPLAGLIGVILLMQFGLAFGAWVQADGALGLRQAVAPAPSEMENTKALGLLIYDKYIYLFQASGLILLVAMVGAIVLTLRHRKGVKRQNVLAQMYRDPAKAMDLVDVKPGQGL
jgi:NADH-quinone oxidoreductase subunit J